MRRLLATLTATVLWLGVPVATAQTPTEGQQECKVGTQALVPEAPAILGSLGITDTWPLSRGAVTVAVVDSGVAAANIHLGEAVLPGLDVTGESNGRVDIQGHGTAIAGQIAARPVDGSGLVGVAPDATILPVRVYTGDRATGGAEPEPGQVAQGIRWAADQGARVIVVALASTVDSPELREAVTHATQLGALVVAPAGNAERDKDPAAARYPAAYPEVLSVTATDRAGMASTSVIAGPHVEVAAPGSDVLTTFLSDGDCVLAGGQPASSFATGYVAGVAALVAAAHPEETPADWEYRILTTALRPHRAERSDALGWGLVAPRAAVEFINDGRAAGPSNPRFPATDRPTAEPLPPRPARTDPLPSRLRTLAIVAGLATVVGVGILLGARLVASRRTP